MQCLDYFLLVIWQISESGLCSYEFIYFFFYVIFEGYGRSYGCGFVDSHGGCVMSCGYGYKGAYGGRYGSSYGGGYGVYRGGYAYEVAVMIW